MDLMAQCETYIKRLGTHEVLGGFISPCHASYMFDKLGEESVPNSTRLHLIELALAEGWALDCFMSMTEGGIITNHKVLLLFYERLQEVIEVDNIFWIMGTDNFEIIHPELVERGFHMVICENREEGGSQLKYL